MTTIPQPPQRKPLTPKQQEAQRSYRETHREVLRERAKAYREANHEACLERTRKWQVATPERRRRYARQRYATNPEARRKVSEQAGKWQSTHMQKVRQTKSAWKRRNPFAVREYSRRRAIRIKQFAPVNYFAILAKHGWVCHICGELITHKGELHFDHMIPIAKGGAHTADNIRPAHAACNYKKGTKIYYVRASIEPKTNRA